MDISYVIMSAEPAVETSSSLSFAPTQNFMVLVLKSKICRLAHEMYPGYNNKLNELFPSKITNEIDKSILIKILHSNKDSLRITELQKYLQNNILITTNAKKALCLKCYIDCVRNHDRSQLLFDPDLQPLIQIVGEEKYLHAYIGYLETLQDIFDFMQALAVIHFNYVIPDIPPSYKTWLNQTKLPAFELTVDEANE